MKDERCHACGREITKRNAATFRVAGMAIGCRTCSRTEQRADGPERKRPARSSKILRRSMEAEDALGFVPTRYAVRMGRRFNPAA